MFKMSKRMGLIGEVQMSSMTQLRPLVFVFLLFLVGFLFSWYPSKVLLFLPLLGTPLMLALMNHRLVFKKAPDELKSVLKKYFLYDECVWFGVGALSLFWLLSDFSWWASSLIIFLSFLLVLGKGHVFFILNQKTFRVTLKGNNLLVYSILNSEVFGESQHLSNTDSSNIVTEKN